MKRAVALESAAGALAMPEIEGEKSPVKRDSSVKTEVHVSFKSGIQHVTASVST